MLAAGGLLRSQGHGKVADGAFGTHLPSHRSLADVLYPWERRLPGGVIRAGKMPALPGRPSVNDFAVALASQCLCLSKVERMKYIRACFA